MSIRPICLNWTAPNPAISYKVYRGNTMIAQNVTTTSYTDNNLSPGTYTYQVSTVYQGVESPKSTSEQATISQAPTGAINGKFTINSSGGKVYFSEGNLQYVGSTHRWQFAEQQWKTIGTSQSNSSQNTTRDLFGWGTSGWSGCNNTYYRPWDTSNSDGSLYGPPGQYNLTGSYANSDWGIYNTIYSGNTQTTGWRTLTRQEWDYVLNTRSTTSGIRYAKAQVNNINGVILLPDNWSSSYYTLYSTNSSGAGFSSNVISATTWANSLEVHGAVFLSAAGYRYGTSVNNVGSYGYYWSASYNSINSSYNVYLDDGHLKTGIINSRCYGRSVRLVCPAN